MSTLNGTILGGVLNGTPIQIQVLTVRIPELPPGGELDADDFMAVYDVSEGKTVYKNLELLRSFFLHGSAALPQTPILNGDELQIVVTADMLANGGHRVNVPELANKTYKLTRRGQGTLLTTEFNILPSGGWDITDLGDVVFVGEVFFAKIYELAAGTTGTLLSTGDFLNGIAVITASITLTVLHYNKLIHVAGGNNKVQIALPDINDIPANKTLIIPIETMINNINQTTVSASNGQLIYFGNTSNASLILGISEYLWLMSGVDGWYALKASPGLLQVGKPSHDYSTRLNTEMAIGQEVNRADYPRLWLWLQTVPDAIVSETLWQTTVEAITTTENFYKYRSKFSSGNGTTTFRFPDHRDLAYAGLKAGSDVERVPNTVGTGQKDMFRSHTHPYVTKTGTAPQSGNATQCWVGNLTIESGATGGSKTTMKNVGLIPLINI